MGTKKIITRGYFIARKKAARWHLDVSLLYCIMCICFMREASRKTGRSGKREGWSALPASVFTLQHISHFMYAVHYQSRTMPNHGEYPQ